MLVPSGLKLQNNKAPVSEFDKKEPQFCNLMCTLDLISSECEGIGPQRKNYSVMIYKDGDALWEKGLHVDDSPRVLQHTVFYYAGIQFCLRGIHEQYGLR